MNTIPKIKFGEKLGFFTFSGSNNIVYQFKSLYYLFFLTNVLKIPVGWAGLILTIGTVWDAINDPLIGFWATNRKFKSGETVRPFALWYSVPWAITVVFLFTDLGLEDKMAAVVAAVIYILFEIFNTLVSIPYNSMSGLSTNHETDRRSINVFRNLGACVGSAIGAVACLPLLRVFGALGKDGNLSTTGASRGFIIVAIIMGLIVVLGSMIHYFTTRERVKQISEESRKMSPKEIAKMLFSCKSWWFNTLYIICYGVINLLLMSSLTYYATYVLGSTAAATMIQAAYLLASIATSFTVGLVDKWLGRRKTMMLAATLAILGKIWFVLNPFALGAIYLNAITVGIAVTFAFVLFNTNRNNIVDIIEATNGRRIDSMIATSDNLASKLAVAFATLLSTLMLQAAGYDANLTTQPDAAINTINAMLGWVPAIASAIMIIAAFFLPIEKDYKAAIKKLGDRQLAKMQKD